MKLYLLYWRAGERTGDIYCKAHNPAEAVSHFRKTLREHGSLDGVIVTGISEDRGHLWMKVVSA